MVWVPEVSPEANTTGIAVLDVILTVVLTTLSIITLNQLSPLDFKLTLMLVPWKLAFIVVALQANFGAGRIAGVKTSDVQDVGAGSGWCRRRSIVVVQYEAGWFIIRPAIREGKTKTDCSAVSRYCRVI